MLTDLGFEFSPFFYLSSRIILIAMPAFLGALFLVYLLKTVMFWDTPLASSRIMQWLYKSIYTFTIWNFPLRFFLQTQVLLYISSGIDIVYFISGKNT